MSGFNHIRCAWLAAMVAAAAGVVLSCASLSKAAIVTPTPIGFDAKDLDRTLNDNKAGCGSSSKNSQQFPLEDRDQNSRHSEHLKAAIPSSQNSSSSSTTSTCGPAGSGVSLCMFNSTITIADNFLLGRLPAEHGLSLPDPPGTDLLRPPRELMV